MVGSCEARGKDSRQLARSSGLQRAPELGIPIALVAGVGFALSHRSLGGRTFVARLGTDGVGLKGIHADNAEAILAA